MNRKLLFIPVSILVLMLGVSCTDSTKETSTTNSTSSSVSKETEMESKVDDTKKDVKTTEVEKNMLTKDDNAVMEDDKMVKKDDTNKSSASDSNKDLKEFTLEELKKFDGKNGSMAYVVIDGLVYDVTNVDAWNKGMHKGNQAGADLSSEISKSPHKKSVLEKLTVVGKLSK